MTSGHLEPPRRGSRGPGVSDHHWPGRDPEVLPLIALIFGALLVHRLLDALAAGSPALLALRLITLP